MILSWKKLSPVSSVRISWSLPSFLQPHPMSSFCFAFLFSMTKLSLLILPDVYLESDYLIVHCSCLAVSSFFLTCTKRVSGYCGYSFLWEFTQMIAAITNRHRPCQSPLTRWLATFVQKRCAQTNINSLDHSRWPCFSCSQAFSFPSHRPMMVTI
jgi:hypothetical protein